MEIEQRITELVDKWCSIVGTDHHKDRDCHFMVETRWSYGKPPTYEIDHYGYIYDEFHIAAPTYSAALEGLEVKLKQMIAHEEAWRKENAAN